MSEIGLGALILAPGAPRITRIAPRLTGRWVAPGIWGRRMLTSMQPEGMYLDRIAGAPRNLACQYVACRKNLLNNYLEQMPEWILRCVDGYSPWYAGHAAGGDVGDRWIVDH